MSSPRSAVFCCATLSFIVPAVSQAAPVTYNINFAGGGLLPHPVKFTYDSSLVSNPFTNFSIAWNGGNFDLTSAANSGPSRTGCLGTSTPAAVFALLSGTAQGCTTTPQYWNADPEV